MDEKKEKRADGEGSVRQRKDGRWEGTYSVGYDETTGKRKRKNVLAKTREECEKKLKKAIRDYNKQIKIERSKQRPEAKDKTLGAWIDKWYKLYCKPGIRESTAATYEACIYTHIIPKIGAWELEEITTSKLDKYIADLLTKGKVRVDGNGNGLSNEVVRKIHALLQSALERAVSEGLIKGNPAKNCEVPSKHNQKVDILTQEEIKRVLIQAKEDGCFELLLLDITTGLRRGELLGLKWEDIDFNSNVLSIRREVVLIKGKPTITPLKSEASYRSLILPPKMAMILKQYKQEVDSEWIFPSPIKENMPRDPSAVRKKLSNVLERAKCKHVRFHALRHTFATIALQYGLDIKTLSSTIGHSSVELTLDTYSHVTDNMRYDAADKIDTTIGRNKGKESSSKKKPESVESTEKFEAYKGKKRKPGTGYVKQISANCWQGRYTPTIDGKRVSKNVYGTTEEECEKKLADLISEMKEIIKNAKMNNGITMA